MALVNSFSALSRKAYVAFDARKIACVPIRHFLPILATTALGVLLSCVAWLLIFRWEDRHGERAFNVVAENHFMVLQNGINEYLNKILALRALFDSSDDHVSRTEF